MGIIKAVCVSTAKGTAKTDVRTARFIEDYGIEGDAHAGKWHRQVSLLSQSQIDRFDSTLEHGAFGENLIVDGLELSELPAGTRLLSGSVLLEITQRGKECHSDCAIRQRTGDCIMPKVGVFARVLSSGVVSVGDEIAVLERDIPVRAAVITLSDRAANGERGDVSGSLTESLLRERGYEIAERVILPDGIEPLKSELINLCDRRNVQLILTTGGTGFSPRDLTPEATRAVAERDAPGIAEALRAASMKSTPNAMLSRGVSVIRGGTIIINMPGSPSACRECMSVFMDVIPHAIELLRGGTPDS